MFFLTPMRNGWSLGYALSYDVLKALGKGLDTELVIKNEKYYHLIYIILYKISLNC
jgi:hypothetical protein